MRNNKQLKLLTITLIMIGVFSKTALASELEAVIQPAFDNQPVKIKDYDQQLKEIVVDSKSYFTTHDGRYIFAGPIFDTQEQIDIVTVKQNSHRSTFLKSQPNDLFVVYPSITETEHELIVFTAINCPYCRKFHNQMTEFNQLGITVKYVMLPRGGVGSQPYKKTLSALCSDNPEQSITLAMQNEKLDNASCSSSRLDKHIKLARELSINSTPTIVLPNGELKLGLINPENLLRLLSST